MSWRQKIQCPGSKIKAQAPPEIASQLLDDTSTGEKDESWVGASEELLGAAAAGHSATSKTFAAAASLLLDEGDSPSDFEEASAPSTSTAEKRSHSKKSKSRKKTKKESRKSEKSADELADDWQELSSCTIKRNSGQTCAVEFWSDVFSVDARYLNYKTVLNKNPKKQRHKFVSTGSRIVTPGANWLPAHSNGLSMKVIGTEMSRHGKTTLFKFFHNKDFWERELMLRNICESANHHALQNFAFLHPYHPNGLIALSDLRRMDDDLQNAALCIEKALYYMETRFDASFRLNDTTARLHYRYYSNRALFIALFKHMVTCGKRGHVVAALELSKLLYSLCAEEDPLAVSLLMDYYALTVENIEQDIEHFGSRFFVQIFESVYKAENVPPLPNLLYSFAFAWKIISAHDSSDDNVENARDAFGRAIIQYPCLVRHMLLKVCEKFEDASLTPSHLKTLLTTTNHPLFVENRIEQLPAGLKALLLIYGATWTEFWRSHIEMDPDWFNDCLHYAISSVETEKHSSGSYIHSYEEFKEVAKPVKRHSYLTGNSYGGAHDVSFTFDPYPPSNNEYDGIILKDDSSEEGWSGNIVLNYLRTLNPGWQNN